MLNDLPGNVYSNNVLLPYFNAAYDDLWQALSNNGQETFISDDVYITVPGINQPDPSATVIVSDTNITIAQSGTSTVFSDPALAAMPANFLPVDLMNPLRLWEQYQGGTNAFIPMVDLSAKGGLPSQDQATAQLQFWEWREDGLCFIGSLSNVRVRIRYQKMIGMLSDPTAVIAARNGINFLTFQTAYYASKARAPEVAATWKTDADEALFQLELSAARRDQSAPRRRRPHSGGTGRRWWT